MNVLVVILWVGGAMAVIMLFVGIIVSITSERALVEERLGRYVEREVETVSRGAARKSPVTDWLNTKVERSSLGDSISKELARADVKLKSGEYILVMFISAFGVGLVAWYITGMSFAPLNMAFISIAALVGFFIPRFYVTGQQSKRLVHFNEQLADMLNLMVNGLRAGYSTTQAMEVVSKELPAPISDEFRRVVQEMQLGVSMEKALDNLLRRIPSDDLDLVITSINVQRESGGNLAEILDTISYTIRDRVRIKGEIRVLTSQVMYSGRFLSLLPIIVMGILYLLNPAYMMEYFKPENNANLPCGYIALGVAALLIIAGYFVMNKLGEVEI
jgi:tight adherence protein B